MNPYNIISSIKVSSYQGVKSIMLLTYLFNTEILNYVNGSQK